MNILQSFRQFSSKLILVSSVLQKQSKEISAHLKNQQAIQLMQLIQSALPASYKVMSQSLAIQLVQSYQQQICMDTLKLSTLQQLRNTIALSKQFMKFTQGIQKWQSWIKASNQAVAQLSQAKQSSVLPQTQSTGCHDCAMKVIVKGKYSDYTPFCQKCQQQTIKKLSLASMYIRARYIYDSSGKPPVQLSRVHAKYGQQQFYQPITKAIDQVVKDNMNWQCITSFYTFCLTPFLTYSQTVKNQLTAPTITHLKGYNCDVTIMFLAHPTRGVYQSKITYNLCFYKGQWKWKAQLPPGKSAKPTHYGQYQYYDSIKVFLSHLISHVRLNEMKISGSAPVQVVSKPKRRQD